MLNAKEVEFLLSKLCVDLGFCLPADEWVRFQENPPNEINVFTDAIFIAEGLNPQYAERKLYRQVQAVIAEAFQKHDEAEAIEDYTVLHPFL